MKKLMPLFILFLFALSNLEGQNLVPNGSFENITTCNFSGGGEYLGYIPPWNSPSAGSPELFDTCCTNQGWRVPNVGYGYQQPHSGNGFVGFGLYENDEFKEYIQVQLDSTLITGKTYCVSFYVSLANISKYAISNIGIYFNDTNTYIPTYNYLNFVPQINNTNIITDTANWTLISGQYIAQGGEKYIIIGNFFADNMTNSIIVNTSSSSQDYAYYFVDDVSIVDCTGVGITEGTNTPQLTLYPNPATEKITIEVSGFTFQKASLKVINVLGQSIQQLTTTNQQQIIDMSSVANGIYFVEVQSGNQVFRKKIIKQ